MEHVGMDLGKRESQIAIITEAGVPSTPRPISPGRGAFSEGHVDPWQLLS